MGNEQADPLWADTIAANPAGIFAWDLRSLGGVIAPGRYALRVTATDGSGRAPASVTRTLVISRAVADTIVARAFPV